ncbi:hypothetical protein BH23CHL5_BH23CHL5_06020 [soil metagenome]
MYITMRDSTRGSPSTVFESVMSRKMEGQGRMDGVPWKEPLLRGIGGTVLLAALATISWWRLDRAEESSDAPFDLAVD